MSRIAAKFRLLHEQGRKALIPFITAGDPYPSLTVSLMHKLVASGADIIELGVPFSDPMADGPVIQRASERALEHHVALHDVLDMVSQFRQKDDQTPVVLMGYLNPIEVMGYEVFARAAEKAGVDGALTVDMPPEEAGELMQLLRQHNIDPIFLLAPTSNSTRTKLVTAVASGFVYYVSLKGVTGAGHLALDTVAKKLDEIRQLTDIPLGVGFGIKDAEMAANMAKLADAVVVGSALVSRVEANLTQPEQIADEIAALLTEMRHSIDQATTG